MSWDAKDVALLKNLWAVGQSAAQLKGAGGDDREHVFTQGLKVFCSHW